MLLMVSPSPLLVMFAHLPMSQSLVRSARSIAQQPAQVCRGVDRAGLCPLVCAEAVPVGNRPPGAGSLPQAGLREDGGLPSRRGHFSCGLGVYVNHVAYRYVDYVD